MDEFMKNMTEIIDKYEKDQQFKQYKSKTHRRYNKSCDVYYNENEILKTKSLQ